MPTLKSPQPKSTIIEGLFSKRKSKILIIYNSMSKLALLGGKPILAKKLKPYQSMGDDERRAVADVIDSDCLSGFYGSWEEGFLGGPKIIEFEEKWSDKFKSKFSISVNSNTSGLYASVGAVGTSPGATCCGIYSLSVPGTLKS